MRGLTAFRFFPIILAMLIAIAPADASRPEQLLQEAIEEAGLDTLGLDPKLSESAGTLPPGLSEIPGDDGRPQVILPGTPLGASDRPLFEDAHEAPKSGKPAFFGSEFFRGAEARFRGPAFGPVPESYLLGPGDQLLIDIWGEVELRQERVVDRDGTVLLPKGGKIACAGLTLAEAESEIRRQLARSFSGLSEDPDEADTFLSLSLGRLRIIRVHVVGKVLRPGTYELSSVSTILAALEAAGGPSDGGSYRSARLMRGDSRIAELDLYRYFLEGRRVGDGTLREGDTVFVPGRGRAVSVLGQLRRPGFYELREGEGLGELLSFCGGFTAEASTEVLALERILPEESREPGRADRVQIDLSSTDIGFPLLDGDRILVRAIESRVDRWVEIFGNVKQPGRYAWSEGMTAASLVALAGGPWEDTLLERALLDRMDATGRRFSADMNLGRQLGGEDPPVTIRNFDRLTVFSIWDIEDRATVDISGDVRRPGRFEFREAVSLRDLLLKAGGLLESADLDRIEVFRQREEVREDRGTAPPPEHHVERIPVKLDEDWLLSPESFPLKAHDHVAVRRLPWWEGQRRVEMRGELLFPGSYSLSQPGSRLSELIVLAGGVKPTADPLGARITRSQDGVGNVALDLDAALDNPGSQHDPVLAPGDVVTIPPLSHTVKVVGAVGFPTSVIYVKGRSLKDYVEMAGGFAEGSDKGGTQVVYPNGVSRSLRWFGFRQPRILAGSTIVVPFEKPREGDSKLETLREITAIIASVATVWLVIDRTQ